MVVRTRIPTTASIPPSGTGALGINGNAVSLEVTGMVRGNTITVTYYNVKVNVPNTFTEIMTGMTGYSQYVQVSENIDSDLEPAFFMFHTVPTDEPSNEDLLAGALTIAQQTVLRDMTAITVTVPERAIIDVKPKSFTAGEMRDSVAIHYEIGDDSVYEENVVVINLPSRWKPSHGNTIATSAGMPSFGADLMEDVSRKTSKIQVWTNMATPSAVSTDEVDPTSFVEVVGSFGRRPGGVDAPTATVALAANGVVTITVSSTDATPMVKGDKFAVAYHNVTVRELTITELEDLADAPASKVQDSIVVMDNIPPADPADTALLSKYDVMVPVMPPQPSTVTVTDDDAEEGQTRNVKVTYVAQGKVFGENIITIGLPDGWTPAYSHSGEEDDSASFGDVVLLTAPRDTRSRSFVLLEYDDDEITVDDTEEGESITVFSDGYEAYLNVTVEEGMAKGDTIAVTFFNVKVEDLAGAGVKTVNLLVEDSISKVAVYDVVIKVVPMRLGDVRVEESEVTADSEEDLIVKYTATKDMAMVESSTGADDQTYGVIQVDLPKGWGPDGKIYTRRQPGTPDATYLSTSHSRGVILGRDNEGNLNKADGDPVALTVDGSTSGGWTVYIDIDAMKNNQYVILTVHNLRVSSLVVPRKDRLEDIHDESTMETAQVSVLSDRMLGSRSQSLTYLPKTVKPKVAVADGGSDYQPTVKVGRKTQGEIAALSPAEVTAGSKQDFTITYKATEALEEGDVIEVRLPKGWDSDLSNDSEADPPTPYQLDDDKPTDDGEVSYVYLGGSTSRLEGTKISVINDAGHDAFEADGDRDDGVTAAGGWFVRIVIGSKRVSKNGTIVLKYNDVTVQRRLTIDDPASVEVFSGPPVEGLPQLPPSIPRYGAERSRSDTRGRRLWYGHV